MQRQKYGPVNHRLKVRDLRGVGGRGGGGGVATI